jgi:hypothetical protein
MKLLTQRVNTFQMMLVLGFCLVNVVEIKGMDKFLRLKLKRTYYSETSRNSSSEINVPFNPNTKEVDGNVFAAKIFEGLTPQERSVSMVLRGYPHGEEVVLSKSEIQANPVRSFSSEEITEMRYVKVVVFLDKLNQ